MLTKYLQLFVAEIEVKKGAFIKISSIVLPYIADPHFYSMPATKNLQTTFHGHKKSPQIIMLNTGNRKKSSKNNKI